MTKVDQLQKERRRQKLRCRERYSMAQCAAEDAEISRSRVHEIETELERLGVRIRPWGGPRGRI